MPTFEEYAATLAAAQTVNISTDKVVLFQSGAAKTCNPDDLSSGGGITALTGEVTASGSGSVPATITAGVNATKIADGSVSNTEFQYLNGVTSAIQAQLDGKQASDSDLTAIAALTPSNDDFLQRKAGAWTNRTIAQVKSDLGVPTYAKYVALLSQTGTDAPVATVLENTLGGTVVWSYNSAGSYVATLVGAFSENKTTVFCSQSSNGVVVCGRDNADEVFLTTLDSSITAADDQLNGSSIEIRVYP